MKRPTGSILKSYTDLAEFTNARTGVVTTTSVSDNGFLYNPVRSGSSDPSYLIKIKRRTDASSPYTRTWLSGSPCVLTVDMQYKLGATNSSFHGQRNYGLESYMTPPAATTSVKNVTISKFRSKLSDHTEEFKAIAPIAELREAKSIVTSMGRIAKTLLLDLRKIRQSKKLSYKTRYGRASDAWLTFNFGISPLMGDVRKLASAIGALERQPRMVHISAKHSDRYFVASNPTPDTELTAGMSIKKYVQSTIDVQYKLVGGYLVTSLSGEQAIREHFGITLPDLTIATWELLPYSWLIDWFTGAGDVLSDSITLQPSPIYLNVVERTTMTSSIFREASRLPSSNVAGLQSNCTPGQNVSGRYTRGLLTKIPSRALEIRDPTHGDWMKGIRKLVTLITLFTRE